MPEQNHKRPWASLAGLLIGCTITIIGIVSGLEPDVILLRALIGGLAFAVVTAVVAGILQDLTQER